MNHIADIAELLLKLGLSSTVTETERAVALMELNNAEAAVRKFLGYDPTSGTRTEYYPTFDLQPYSSSTTWDTSSTQVYERNLSSAAGTELQLRHLPVRGITSVRIDYGGRFGTASGSFGSDTQKTEGTDYWANYERLDSSGNRICMDGLLRSQGLWPSEPGSVRVIYTSGYTDAELHSQDSVIDASPILKSVLEEAMRHVIRTFSLQKKTGVGFVPGVVTSERMGDYSYTIDATVAKEVVSTSEELLAETVERLGPFVNYGAMLGG